MPDTRVIIVTGGADGFGAAIVDRFSKDGSMVILIDVNKVGGEKKAAENENLYFIHGDVTQKETWEEAVALGRKEHGRVDLIVNNAGITHDPLPVHEQNLELYDKIFCLNVKSIFLSAQVVCPIMLEQGHGIFINIASTGCTRPRPGMAFYNASKAAVAVATKTMALEYAPTIRFNCIAPAVGNTSMLQKSIGKDENAAERLQKLRDSLPMKRITEPSDIANAAWYLGTEQSSFVTGTILEVDGGRGV